MKWASFSMALPVLISCQVAVGSEASNEHGGYEFRENLNGNNVLNGQNNSGENLEGQWLDENKNPIDVDGDGQTEDDKFDIPDGDVIMELVPNGATWLQIGDAPAGLTVPSVAPIFKFHRVLPGSRDFFLPGSGHHQSEVSYSAIEAQASISDGWELSRQSFKTLGLPLPVVAGTSVLDHVRVVGDRSYQMATPLSRFPVLLEIADEGLITSFDVFVDGVLVADQDTSTVNLQSGSWGSLATVWGWTQPSLTWLNGVDIQVRYTVQNEAQDHNISIGLSAG